MARVGLGLFGAKLSVSLSHTGLTTVRLTQINITGLRLTQINITGLRLTQINITSVRLTPLATIRLTQLGYTRAHDIFQFIDVCSSLLHL